MVFCLEIYISLKDHEYPDKEQGPRCRVILGPIIHADELLKCLRVTCKEQCDGRIHVELSTFWKLSIVLLHQRTIRYIIGNASLLWSCVYRNVFAVYSLTPLDVGCVLVDYIVFDACVFYWRNFAVSYSLMSKKTRSIQQEDNQISKQETKKV